MCDVCVWMCEWSGDWCGRVRGGVRVRGGGGDGVFDDEAERRRGRMSDGLCVGVGGEEEIRDCVRFDDGEWYLLEVGEMCGDAGGVWGVGVRVRYRGVRVRDIRYVGWKCVKVDEWIVWVWRGGDVDCGWCVWVCVKVFVRIEMVCVG